MRSVCPKQLVNLALGAAVFAAPVAAAELEPTYWETYGDAEIEATFFPESPRFAGQERHNISFAIHPTLFAEWSDGAVTATFSPFARVDWADKDRTHVDIREAKLDFQLNEWDATVGLDTVFWGKTEAAHLVDIINQTDALEDIDDEDSLGQPMIRIGRQIEFGTIQAFFLPFFREREFPGQGGRLRSGLLVDEDQSRIDADGGNLAPSFALRYDGVFGAADIGVSGFHGVSRDPGFEPTDFVATPNGLAPTALRPVYDRITQVGMDGQYTSDATLWKAEGIYRYGQTDLNGVEDSYFGASAGIEHTLFSVYENADLGLIAEYAFDSRGRDATTTFNNDIILGARLALNDEADTSLLVTSAIDHRDGVASFRVEGQTRIGDGLVAELEATLFVNGEDDPLGADFQDDTFVRAKLRYFW